MKVVNLQVYLLQIIFGSFWTHQLNGRYAHLQVQQRQLLPVALVDYSFCLLLLEHFEHYHQVMRAVFFPLGLALKEELHIHYLLHFSEQPLLISSLLLSNLELLPLAVVFLNHQSMITTGNEGMNG